MNKPYYIEQTDYDDVMVNFDLDIDDNKTNVNNVVYLKQQKTNYQQFTEIKGEKT